MNKISVVIADDMSGIRKYFKTILKECEDIEVVGEAVTGMEAVEVVMEKRPDVVLMDIQMETERAGIDAIEKIRQAMEHVKIIVITIHEEDDTIFASYSVGANDYLIKTAAKEKIIQSIREVYANKLQMRNEIAEKILKEVARLKNEKTSMIFTLNIISKLTNSEYEVLYEIYNGVSYKEIARKRFVEECTIKKQITGILKKFDEPRISRVIKLLKELSIFEIYFKK